MAGRERTGKEMAGMAKSLERDPQVELVLSNRTRELGLEIGMGRGRGMNSGDLGRELAAFGFRGFVHHADAFTALIAHTTDRVSRARVSFRSMPASTRSDEQTSELQSLMRISYAVFCLKIINVNKV